MEEDIGVYRNGVEPLVDDETRLKKELKKESKKSSKKKKSKKKTRKVDEILEEDVGVYRNDDVALSEDALLSETVKTDNNGTENHKDVRVESRDEVEGESDFEADDDRKVFISRVPACFDEESVTRSLQEAFGEDSVERVALAAPKNDDDNGDEGRDKKTGEEHRGFAYVTMTSVDFRNEAIQKGTLKCKAKELSKRKFTLYIRPIIRDDNVGDDSNRSNMCFLWSKNRCPYGDSCKFQHVGEGGCILIKETENKKCRQKCFTFKTKGKCKLGDNCPYSHDFEPKVKSLKTQVSKDSKEKDCINWKTKGKCRKGDKCIYRHLDSVREAFLAKKVEKKANIAEKRRQPLSIRVFGLNYDTTEKDVREYFNHCGTIREITFPSFEDSGRSKGYCGILFVSPKAVEQACLLDGQELHGRWLSVQGGKMYLKQWEERENERLGEPKRGEFGQSVKRRKRNGFD